MVNGRKPCSRPLRGGERSLPWTLGKANARAVASRELGSASLRQSGVASLSEMVKPAPVGKIRSSAPTGLPGVEGDSARGKNH